MMQHIVKVLSIEWLLNDYWVDYSEKSKVYWKRFIFDFITFMMWNNTKLGLQKNPEKIEID